MTKGNFIVQQRNYRHNDISAYRFATKKKALNFARAIAQDMECYVFDETEKRVILKLYKAYTRPITWV